MKVEIDTRLVEELGLVKAYVLSILGGLQGVPLDGYRYTKTSTYRIAKMSGLAQPTVYRAVVELIKLGYIKKKRINDSGPSWYGIKGEGKWTTVRNSIL